MDQPERQYTLSDEAYLEGKRLTETYCTGCHVYPDPELLPKETWKSETLPAMAPMLGIREHNGSYYRPNITANLPPDFYPSEPLLDNEEWQKILDFYIDLAPDRLQPAQRNPEIVKDSLFFEAHVPAHEPEVAPVVTAIIFDPGNRMIYLSDASETGLLVFNENLELENRVTFPDLTPNPISDIRFLNDPNKQGERQMLLTYIGHLNPSDAPLGSVVEGWYDPENGEADLFANVHRDSLARPVESLPVDMNGNGLKDLLVAEFGHRTGKLSWLENREGRFETKKNELIETPGCIQSYFTDFTNNGLKDVVSLCTQVDQTIYLFKNQGNGIFEKEKLVQFKLTAGSSSFELHDFNGNGHLDILYTSGDNADFSKIYKPYHGVYIYLNDTQNNFTEEWFYPINGAYRAIARDFNKNGYLDIAVISFFPDNIRRPEEGFIFFKNEGGLTFTPFHHPMTSIGRWLTMDVKDWTGNGYDDILLANFSEGSNIEQNVFSRDWQDGPYFLLLKNKADEN